MVNDEDAALQAIKTLGDLSTEQHDALKAINQIIQNGEPFVDIHELFAYYNVLYFQKLLLPRVEVLWSPRLTLCAGICELSKDPSTGKLTRIRLKLSTPLLQYRPRSDTVNTLLHEAIHAYFFITTSWKHSRGDDGTGHGAGFLLFADAINNHGGYEITIYHTFHDEVDNYRTHVWQCDGPCKTQPPYFGAVKRSMNRAPGKSDTWWTRYQVDCGGTYTKIQEPVVTKKQLDAMSAKERAGRQKNKIDGWITARAMSGARVEDNILEKASTSAQNKRKASTLVIETSVADQSSTAQKRSRGGTEDESLIIEKTALVRCPICDQSMVETIVNEHLDGFRFN
ncbi:SprT-like family-domain-containing protein [Phaeosphaeriaceae sp. PMI808]|nr:SprT-like family-domain-containing protein [Phaeosphaeriaceae sp. PMI808]